MIAVPVKPFLVACQKRVLAVRSSAFSPALELVSGSDYHNLASTVEQIKARVPAVLVSHKDGGGALGPFRGALECTTEILLTYFWSIGDTDKVTDIGATACQALVGLFAIGGGFEDAAFPELATALGSSYPAVEVEAVWPSSWQPNFAWLGNGLGAYEVTVSVKFHAVSNE